MDKILLFEQWNAVNEVGDSGAKAFKWKPFKNVSKTMKQAVDNLLAKTKDGEHTNQLFEYFFKNDDGIEYVCSFSGWVQNTASDAKNLFTGEVNPARAYDSSFNVSFNLAEDYFANVEVETNLNEMFRVMATVTEIAFNFLEECEKSGYPVKNINVVAKGDNEKLFGNDTRRGRIYLAYIKKQIKRLKTKSKYTAMRSSSSGKDKDGNTIHGDIIKIKLGDWKGANIIEKVDMKRVEDFADDKLDPVDVEFTKHFFDRLARVEHDKEISDAELIGFFKRLSKKKKQFDKFMKQYDEFVVKDERTDINIPFKAKVDQIIAKTIMRKKDFKTSDPEYDI